MKNRLIRAEREKERERGVMETIEDTKTWDSFRGKGKALTSTFLLLLLLLRLCLAALSLSLLLCSFSLGRCLSSIENRTRLHFSVVVDSFNVRESIVPKDQPASFREISFREKKKEENPFLVLMISSLRETCGSEGIDIN